MDQTWQGDVEVKVNTFGDHEEFLLLEAVKTTDIRTRYYLVLISVVKTVRDSLVVGLGADHDLAGAVELVEIFSYFRKYFRRKGFVQEYFHI